MRFQVRTVSKQAFKLIVLSSLVTGCAKNIPQVEGLSVGIPTMGVVVKKLVVEDNLSFSQERFTDFGNQGSQLIAAKEFGLIDPLSSFVVATAGALGSAIFGETESQIKELRCLYEVKVEDSSIYNSIRSSIFIGSIDGGFSGFNIADNELILPSGETILKSDATQAQLDEWEIELARLQESAAPKGETLTVPQSCIVGIEKGSNVFMSFHQWGATLHRVREEDAVSEELVEEAVEEVVASSDD